MNIDPQIAHQRSTRLKDFDYTEAAAYYVTLVTQGRRNLFGEIIEGVMNLNWMGEVIRSVWLGLEDYFPICLDAWVIMPNHMHTIIWITGINPPKTTVNPTDWAPWRSLKEALPQIRTKGIKSGSVSAIVKNFIVTSTRKIKQNKSRNDEVKNRRIVLDGFADEVHRVRQRIWQRNYYEHLIVDQVELEKVREYITNNPHLWIEEMENPERLG